MVSRFLSKHSVLRPVQVDPPAAVTHLIPSRLTASVDAASCNESANIQQRMGQCRDNQMRHLVSSLELKWKK